MREAVQVVTNQAEPEWKCCNLNGTSASEIWADEKTGRFDLENDPLVRCSLFAHSADEHVLFVSLPSLCAKVSTEP
jgi:hypothetical protein